MNAMKHIHSAADRQAAHRAYSAPELTTLDLAVERGFAYSGETQETPELWDFPQSGDEEDLFGF